MPPFSHRLVSVLAVGSQTRFSHVQSPLDVENIDAVKAARDHLLDMLHLCRGHNMGLRDVVPAVYLRPGRDQECCDFCKWWKEKRDGAFDYVKQRNELSGKLVRLSL